MSTEQPTGVFREIEALQEQSQKDRQKLIELEESIRWVMASKSGRSVIAWILDHTGYMDSVTNTDPMLMMQSSARRDIGVEVSSALRMICPDEMRLMEKENDND